MDDRQGNTFSFQLTTKDTDDLPQVEKISTGRYEQQLTPPVFVPFNATPTVALYDLTFANTMANIDPAYKNDTLVLGFGTNGVYKFEQKVPGTGDVPASVDPFIDAPYVQAGDFNDAKYVNNEITIKIPKGNYTLSDLEVAIANMLAHHAT
jgi:hypothetical protein